MFGYFTVLAIIPGFVLSSLIFMAPWEVITPDCGIKKIGYTTAMLITISSWLTMAPLATTTGRRKR